MKNNYDIKEIIKGCLQEKQHYQRALVDQYSGLLHVICQRYIGESNSAKDALQDTLLRIFRNLNTYQEDKGTFEAWISTIAIRQCLTLLKKNKLDVVPLEAAASDTSYDIEADILSNYDIDFLVALINELPTIYKSVFNLVAIDGYSHKEAAELLDIPIGTSRVRLKRAKSLLKDKVLLIQKNESWVNTI